MQEGILGETILIAMNLPGPRGKVGGGIVTDNFVSFSVVNHDLLPSFQDEAQQLSLRTKQRPRASEKI